VEKCAEFGQICGAYIYMPNICCICGEHAAYVSIYFRYMQLRVMENHNRDH